VASIIYLALTTGGYAITVPAPAELGAYVAIVYVDGVRAVNAVSAGVLRLATLLESASSVAPGPAATPTTSVVTVQSQDEFGSPVPNVAGLLLASATFSGPDPPPAVGPGRKSSKVPSGGI